MVQASGSLGKQIKDSGVEDRKLAQTEENFIKSTGKTIVDQLALITEALGRVGDGSLKEEQRYVFSNFCSTSDFL